MIDFKAKSDFLKDLMYKLTFPADAMEDILNAFCRISENQATNQQFASILKQYDHSVNCDYRQMLADTIQLGNVLNIHEYTVSLLLFLCMAERLRSYYDAKGIEEKIYYNTLMDLRYKLEECRLIYGINGSFVASWFSGFFDLTRFALSRLQFEMTTIKGDYQLGGRMFPADTKAIAVHIPRTGTRLDHNEVLESYSMAAEFFAAEFQNLPIIFNCDSWLLDPWNLTALSPKSNLAAFFKDFKIVYTHNYGDYEQVWRLFDCLYTGNPADLPRDSSLRRAYAERIERGEPIGWGRGLFIYQQDEIINN